MSYLEELHGATEKVSGESLKSVIAEYFPDGAENFSLEGFW